MTLGIKSPFVCKFIVKYFTYLQLARLQTKRLEELQRLRSLVFHVEKDKTIPLDTSWKAYFKRCLDWSNLDGQAASFSDIEKRYKEVQRHVRYRIC